MYKAFLKSVIYYHINKHVLKLKAILLLAVHKNRTRLKQHARFIKHQNIKHMQKLNYFSLTKMDVEIVKVHKESYKSFGIK